MRQIKHPLVERDLISMVSHIVEVTKGDFAAAARRLDQVDALIRDIGENPGSGVRLSGPLKDWSVRHGGQDYRLTVVFRADIARDILFIALIAFAGQDWMNAAEGRRGLE